MDVVNTPRWEDYEIKYMNVRFLNLMPRFDKADSSWQSNQFMFMGNGISAREANKEDLTYCNVPYFLL